jgi:hypothetical protein
MEIAKPEEKKLTSKLVPKVIQEARSVFREHGLKGVIRRFGWKFFAFFFIYYLIRDLTLYVLIPWYIARHLL